MKIRYTFLALVSLFAVSMHAQNTTTPQREGNWDFRPLTRYAHSGRVSTSAIGIGNIYTDGLGFGLVNAVNAPADMDVDMGASYEFRWDIASATFMPHRSNLRWLFAVGAGVDWRNYRMTGRSRFCPEGDSYVIAPYPEGATPNFSRFKVFSVTFPLTFAFVVTRHINLHLGAIANVNTYASLKTRYTLDGQGKKEFYKDVRKRPITFDLHTKLMYDNVGVFAKYSPCEVLHSDYAPKFNSFSFGIMVGY